MPQVIQLIIKRNMLSSHLAKRAHLMAQKTSVRYFSLNASALQQAAQDPAHLNWTQFFQTVKPADVAGSDVISIATLLKVLSFAGEHNEAAEHQSELYSALDEYFRLKFRKLSGKEATLIVSALSTSASQRLEVLDDKFWVWETLDEALRPVVSELSESEVLAVSSAMYLNFKGSEDLLDSLERRVYFYGRPTPF
ncbi:hypothetical protein FGO68_gene14706 [Halteria grandinella]|uniref:Uncharacterized protein n=1 Tax=Halteria grandinella TaxID=5974 RepID=A0A8J8NWC0_HALGN|nr:hypothetical protein FGO68_gene14706 [Halteria grandinella]